MAFGNLFTPQGYCSLAVVGWYSQGSAVPSFFNTTQTVAGRGGCTGNNLAAMSEGPHQSSSLPTYKSHLDPPFLLSDFVSKASFDICFSHRTTTRPTHSIYLCAYIYVDKFTHSYISIYIHIYGTYRISTPPLLFKATFRTSF